MQAEAEGLAFRRSSGSAATIPTAPFGPWRESRPIPNPSSACVRFADFLLPSMATGCATLRNQEGLLIRFVACPLETSDRVSGLAGDEIALSVRAGYSNLPVSPCGASAMS